LKGIKFGRVEDLDYKKGSDAGAREIYLMLQDKIQPETMPMLQELNMVEFTN
jgi:hypothetical protein